MLRCRIADLIVDVPDTGDMHTRCSAYRYDGEEKAEIVIKADQYRYHVWPAMDESGVAYMESEKQFFDSLLRYNGMMLHASAIVLDGKAYLFSGTCGIGKSTHSHLWQQSFGSAAQIINDDKPAIRLVDGVPMVYGTPFSGKHDISVNTAVPLKGIAFIERSDTNSIRRLEPREVFSLLLNQTVRPKDEAKLDKLCELIDKLLTQVPVYLLRCNISHEAAQLAYDEMSGNNEISK